ncbi:MAG: hypothetical protein CVU38_16040 [Chloroflexi bacterium HGW-Chloroflexi-1]|nr:MAG: hypothetical protein CVU38_16040 [Chloroflexi bacterium HGW-Chloroflexi-1]
MAQVIRSIQKALETIELLAQAENGLSLSDLAARTGYPISTVHRLLASMFEHGYVEQDPQTKRYYLGLKILALQAQGIRRRHFGRFAFPHLNRLRQHVNETINLGVLSGQDVVYLETFVPNSSMSFYAPPGTRMPSYCTAMGKVLLAHLPPETQDALLSSLELKPFTPHTITSLPALRTELAEIAQRGYAVDNEEYAAGVRCISAPVRDHDSTVVAGVSVTVLAEQLPTERIKPTAALLTQACLDISQALGYQGDS